MALSARCTYIRSIAIVLMLVCEFFSAHVSAEIFLAHNYPLPGDFNRVELRCKADKLNPKVLQDANFFLGETEIFPQTVVGYSRDGGVLSYTITPEREEPLTCMYMSSDGKKTSTDVLKLAGQPTKYHDCENKPVQYRLLPYSEHNLYTIPCLIKPGNLREKYTIVWTQVSSDTSNSSLMDLSKVNTSNFDLYLEAKNLPPGDEHVECRVDIQHDSINERSYCGPKIAVAVKAEIVTQLPPLTRVQSGNDITLSCSAHGTNLTFQWSYRGNTYDSTSDCRNGICVITELSSLDPLSKTSHLLIHWFETTAEGNTTVTCHVTQRVNDWFGAIPLSSSGTLTVYNKVTTTNPPSTTDLPPSTEEDSTSDPATTHATPSALNDQHTFQLAIIIPIALIVLFISILMFPVLRYSCKAKHTRFKKESCIKKTAVISPAALAKHKSIASGQLCPPCQISINQKSTLSSESRSFSLQQSALGRLTNKQRRRNQRQLNVQHQLAQVHSYHHQHSFPIDNRRYSHGNPAQVLKLQRPSSSSEPSLAGEVTGTDVNTGSKVKFSFLSSPLYPNYETTASSALRDETLPIEKTSCEPLIQTSTNSDLSSCIMTSCPQNSATVDHYCRGHPSELCVHKNPLVLSLDPTTGPILDQDKCKDSLTYSHETQILLPTSGPPIDPYNTREYIPTCFTPVATLSQCTHDGRWYHDEHNDFGLEIPAGAIPEGGSITIDIGVALYGPFQYPEGLRPVSPVFWVCVRDQNHFQFLKPVKVTIPHCLNLESHDDIESLGLTFLKGDHEMNSQQMYQFQQAEGDVLIEPLKKCGVIQTTHFCCQCIAGQVTKELMKNANFCISALLPTVIPDTESAYFFITFFLKTCLNVVEEQINEDTALQGHERQNIGFQFSSDGEEKVLEIVLPQSLPGKWEIGRVFRNKISVSDIDFFDKNREELALMEELGIYPPRFRVVITRLSTTTHHVTIVFKGTMNNLELAIPIIPPRPPISPISTSSGYLSISSHEQEVSTPATPLGIDDLIDVITELEDVAVNWRGIGLVLRLRDPDLGAIAVGDKSVYGCLTDMLRLWLNQSYDVIKYGEPSWQMLENAVRARAGGNNPAIADQIHRKYIA